MAKDGEVVISTALDNSQLEKQLQDTKKKIVSLEEKLNKAEQERSPIGSRWKPRLDWQHWSEKMTLC